MTRYGTWALYEGTGRIVLAIVLLAAAGGLVYAGTRLHRPVRLARPGRVAAIGMLLAWVLALGAFVVCEAILKYEGSRHHTATSAPNDPIALVTLTAAVILFVIVFIAAPVSATPRGLWVRLSSAAIAAMAAPMIFELPFDLIVMARVYLPPPDPAWYLAVFFAPLVAIELTTLSLLRLSPMVRLSRPAFCCLALMLAVFAIWALAGFGYPSAPFPIAMNVMSKILAFVTTLALFRPGWFARWWRTEPERGFEEAPPAGQPAVPAI